MNRFSYNLSYVQSSERTNRIGLVLCNIFFFWNDRNIFYFFRGLMPCGKNLVSVQGLWNRNYVQIGAHFVQSTIFIQSNHFFLFLFSEYYYSIQNIFNISTIKKKY